MKLIAANNVETEKKFPLGKFKFQFDLDTPLYEVFPKILEKFNEEDHDWAKKLTTRMILSHTSGLPITHDEKTQGKIKFQFEPGTHYGYSGPGIAFLQEVIEDITESKLEPLAQEYIFKALKMEHSSFHFDKSKAPQAANSLYTTPTDYAKFIIAWMEDPNLQYAFQPQVFMTQDYLPPNWPIERKIPENKEQDIRRYVAWGLGIGLEINDQWGCGLIKMSIDPRQTPFEDIELQQRNALILFNEKLFYADYKKQTISEVEINQSKQKEFNTLKVKFTDSYKLAEPNELQLITTVTGLLHPANKLYITADGSDHRGEVRNRVVVDLQTQKVAIGLFVGANGHAMPLSDHVKLDHASEYFHATYGFAQNFEELGGNIDFFGLNPSRLKTPVDAPKPTTKEKIEAHQQEVKEEISHSNEQQSTSNFQKDFTPL